MTLVSLNTLQRPDDPKLNLQLSSPLVSLSQPGAGYGTGGRAVPATVGGLPHGARVISSQLCTLEP